MDLHLLLWHTMRRSGTKRLLVILLAFTALSIHTLWAFAASRRADTKPPDLGFIPGDPRTSPAVGFDLTTSYGTAAVHHNHSIKDIGKVAASMRRYLFAKPGLLFSYCLRGPRTSVVIQCVLEIGSTDF